MDAKPQKFALGKMLCSLTVHSHVSTSPYCYSCRSYWI